MPNIIEQQDLLKGLPDARLAMLMQNPAGDIPPFLVAAEAQRRQAIRQQFAGAGTNESVVDTLTKQLANVPQNIQAPMQAPPKMPPPMQPQMQQPQQGMADGGMVRRYDVGGPVFRGRAGSGGYETPTDPYGIFGDMYDYVAPALSSFTENMQKFGINPTAEQRAEIAKKASSQAGSGGILDVPLPDIPIVRGRNPLPAAPKTQPRNESAGKKGTSAENQYKAQEAAIRDRLEALYAEDDPSGWEDAQKWFAMSQQFLDPNKNLMQSIAGAGAAFADASAEQARDARRAALAREEALLNYDMQIMQSDRDAAARAAEKASDREFELQKLNMVGGKTAVEAYLEQMKTLNTLITNTIDPEEKANYAEQLRGLQIKIAQLTKSASPDAGIVITRDQLP